MILNKTKYRIQIEAGKGTEKKVKVDGHEFNVDLKSAGADFPNRKSVNVNDEKYLLNIISHKLELGRAAFELEINDKFTSIQALMPHSQGSGLTHTFVQDSTNNIAAGMTNKKESASKSAPPTKALPAAEAKGGIYAPMPGRLVSLKVKKGDKVKAGQVVAILEAMKMENELKSAKPGIVTHINYKPGENVSQDKPIMIIE